jgi:putative membrane protein insertion efficiency factor
MRPVQLDPMSQGHPASPNHEHRSWSGRAFRLYKTVLSPVLHAISPCHCIYLPTCSEYAYVAVSRFGVWRGSWIALYRFARCHPWAGGGVDPVPERKTAEISPASRPV